METPKIPGPWSLVRGYLREKKKVVRLEAVGQGDRLIMYVTPEVYATLRRPNGWVDNDAVLRLEEEDEGVLFRSYYAAEERDYLKENDVEIVEDVEGLYIY